MTKEQYLKYEDIQGKITELEEAGVLSGDTASDIFSDYLTDQGFDGDDYME
eukprot:SAG31_NODE_10454_length_1136_cov_3.360324_1_plen_50_part_10